MREVEVKRDSLSYRWLNFVYAFMWHQGVDRPVSCWTDRQWLYKNWPGPEDTCAYRRYLLFSPVAVFFNMPMMMVYSMVFFAGFFSFCFYQGYSWGI